MNAKRTADQYLADIIEWAERIAIHLKGVSQERFLEEPLLQDAVAKCDENIGEAAFRATRLDPQLPMTYRDFEADFAYSARNAVAHGYFSISYNTLWYTSQTSVPKIASVARRILSDLANSKES